MSEVAADGVTAGMLLRRAREAAGLHVATLAVSLKVPVRKLEALEEDRYDQLSDAVFIRALASSVCRTLKIDPQPVLERLPQSAKPRLVQDREGINAPFRAPGDGPKPGWVEVLLRPTTLAVAALLVGALVIALLPSVVRKDEGTGAAKVEPVMPAGTPSTVVTATVEPLPAPQPATQAPAAAAAQVQPAAAPPARAASAAPAPVAAVTPPVSTPAPAPASVSAPAEPAAALPATGIVVFRAKGPSWVQVVDAKGNAVLRRLLEPGETAGASGALPLSVTVGSVQTTEVLVRGKPFDPTPMARDNVARFEVK